MKSIRTRLLLGLLALLALLAGVFGTLTYRQVLAETEALFDYQLRQMALSLRDQGEIAPEQAEALADEQIDFVVQIWSPDGRTIYASRLHPELPARALLGLADIRAGNQTWRTYSVATRTRVIQVAQPVRVRQRLAADAALRSVMPLLWLAPLLALALGALASWTLRPLQRLAADVRQRDAASLAPLPGTGLPDELAPLVRSLNDLLQRLGGSLDTQRAFVADAAHELRSPLTALRLQLHLLRRASDEADRKEAIDALGAGIERAVRLVEQLLALARSEPGAPPVEPSAVDLCDVARQTLAHTAALAQARGAQVELALAAAPVTVAGDPAALLALARNLVDNALRYSPDGARVRVEVLMRQGQPTLQVDDSGPGIAQAERERVFQRFVRGGASSAESGSGLGLAIVRQVAQRHGATLALDDSPLGGLRVSVRFPAPALPPPA
jgi:two-component system OmpR family sensor kinase/two-component system sensor histidine kinase QseC